MGKEKRARGLWVAPSCLLPPPPRHPNEGSNEEQEAV